MRRPLTFVVGTAAGALLIAAAGVSAHTGGAGLLRMVGVQQSHLGDEASGTRLATPDAGQSLEATTEPSEPPEASPSPEATAQPQQAEEGPDADSDWNDGGQDGDNQQGSGGGDGSGHGDDGGGGGD
ncbi:MAG TPA: hypothetical protein VET26_11680 [Candidatus Sulfotelmatobacter sp.]|nr:hypothetical protein [Candidatus Sulfotelmatobacter sp.]